LTWIALAEIPVETRMICVLEIILGKQDFLEVVVRLGVSFSAIKIAATKDTKPACAG
jgi:hypothetical protein